MSADADHRSLPLRRSSGSGCGRPGVHSTGGTAAPGPSIAVLITARSAGSRSRLCVMTYCAWTLQTAQPEPAGTAQAQSPSLGAFLQLWRPDRSILPLVAGVGPGVLLQASSLTRCIGRCSGQPEHCDDKDPLEHYAEAHLRTPCIAFSESDGELFEAESCLMASIIQLDLHCVTAGGDLVQVKRLEHLSAVAAIATGRIAQRHPE